MNIEYLLSKLEQTQDVEEIVSILNVFFQEKLFRIVIQYGERYCKIFRSYPLLKVVYQSLIEIERYEEASEMVLLLLDQADSRSEREWVWQYSKPVFAHNQKKFHQYPAAKVFELEQKFPNKDGIVTIMMTSSCRLSLFRQTVNSFLHCCKDFDMVREWICIDDQSPLEERFLMQQEYPFIRFIFKDKKNKGHPNSMNMYSSLVKTPYYFALEDDWDFFLPDNFIRKCLSVLQENQIYGQCLLNRNYMEVARDFDLIGGKPMETRDRVPYCIQDYIKDQGEFCKKYGTGRSCGHWPHFSLRVGLTRKSVLQQIGEFRQNEPGTPTYLFELDYAHRYISHGYQTTFLDGAYCFHTGPPAHLRNQPPTAGEVQEPVQETARQPVQETAQQPVQETAQQPVQEKARQPVQEKAQQPVQEKAQQPVQEKAQQPVQQSAQQQLVQEGVILDERTIWVVNLDRRADRLEQFHRQVQGVFSYSRCSAVDGKKLKGNRAIEQLFNNNDYNYRSGMIGCALSHIQLWIQLYNSGMPYYIVFEDDIRFKEHYEKCLYKVVENLPVDCDVLFLGHHAYNQDDRTGVLDRVVMEKWNSMQSLSKSLGGTGGYLITRDGAKRMLDFLQGVGMPNAIDTMMQHACDVMNVYYLTPHLFTTEHPTMENLEKLDTDIQRDYHTIGRTMEERLNDEIQWYGTRNVLIHASTQFPLIYPRDGVSIIHMPHKISEFPKGGFCYYLGEDVLCYIPNNLLDKIRPNPVLNFRLLQDGKYTIKHMI